MDFAILLYTSYALYYSVIKHDAYVQQLVSRLEGYQSLQSNIKIYDKRCDKAEIDLMGVKNGKLHVFEVKCSYRISKAKRQLYKLKRLLKVPMTLYFYCGSADVLEEVN